MADDVRSRRRLPVDEPIISRPCRSNILAPPFLAAKAAPLPPVPARPPDLTMTLAVRPEQALLYRLSGDHNPLHAEPAVARAAGFPSPILHGLCTYGFAGRAVLAAAGDNDPSRLRSLACRFTAPVYPSDELNVQLWFGEENVRFRVAVPARDAIVLDRGHARVL